jgi:hypothetical protein
MWDIQTDGKVIRNTKGIKGNSNRVEEEMVKRMREGMKNLDDAIKRLLESKKNLEEGIRNLEEVILGKRFALSQEALQVVLNAWGTNDDAVVVNGFNVDLTGYHLKLLQVGKELDDEVCLFKHTNLIFICFQIVNFYGSLIQT